MNCDDILSKCIHNVPAKFECEKCNESKQIIELTEQNVSLTEMYKHLSLSISNLQDNKIRQIDDNKKISKTIDDLGIQVSRISTFLFGHDFGEKNLSNRIQDLEESLEKTDEYFEDNFEINGRLNKIEKQLFKLDNLLLPPTHSVTKEEFKAYFPNEENSNKKMQYCPRCKGTGSDTDQTVKLNVKVYMRNGLIVCTLCEGKGIIWK